MGNSYFVNPKHNIPIEFEHISDVVDDRFMRVKVWIAHTGENRNNSIFSKELLESMIPSLANIPILGYIDVNSMDEEDFRGHEERLVIKDNEIGIKYVGRAYGLIPTEHNARFESRFGEDGVEREYLVCDGLIWRKFPEVEQIFDRDHGFKWQSMELQPSSVEGHINENGVFEFTKAKFEGACILGEDVTPAMISSTIEKFSVGDAIQTDLKEMLAEFNAHFSATKEKGDDIVTVENEELELNEVPVVEEPSGEQPSDNFEEEKEDKEEKESTEFADKEEEDEDEEDDKDKEDDKEDEKDDKFTLKFELSHDDIRTSLYQSLNAHPDFAEKWFWISKVYDNHAIVEDEDEDKFYKINYVKHEGAVSIGEYQEIFPMFLSSEEKTAIEMTRANFEALQQEVGKLREFKSEVEFAEKDKVLSQYSAVLSSEEYEAIKTNLSKFTCEDIEKEVGFLLLKKNKFTANDVNGETRVNAINTVDSNPYGSLATYFTKQ